MVPLSLCVPSFPSFNILELTKPGTCNNAEVEKALKPGANHLGHHSQEVMEQDTLVLYQPLHCCEVGLAVSLARIQLLVNTEEQILKKS